MTAPASTSPASTSAVQIWQPNDVLALMEQYPERAFNRLFPIDAISQVNPMLAPRIELVRLNPDENAGEIYHSNDMKPGMYAPTKVGLRRLADLASISTVASRRLDDNSDPWYVLWQVEVELAVPGRRPRRGVGSKEIRLSGDSVKGWSGERLMKAREHMVRMAESKAHNAAIRDLLTLRSSYPKAELTKPFAVFRWEPNMAHPQVSERFLDNLLPATTAAFGPDPKQLTAGADDYEVAPHRPDDEATEGSFVDLGDGRQADATTGEVTAGGPEPDWFGTAATTPPTLVERLRAAAASGSGEAASQQQNERLTGVLKQLALAMPVVQAVIKKAFDVDPVTVEDENGKTVRRIPLTAGQVDALLELSTEDTFVVEFAKAADE